VPELSAQMSVSEVPLESDQRMYAVRKDSAQLQIFWDQQQESCEPLTTSISVIIDQCSLLTNVLSCPKAHCRHGGLRLPTPDSSTYCAGATQDNTPSGTHHPSCAGTSHNHPPAPARRTLTLLLRQIAQTTLRHQPSHSHPSGAGTSQVACPRHNASCPPLSK